MVKKSMVDRATAFVAAVISGRRLLLLLLFVLIADVTGAPEAKQAIRKTRRRQPQSTNREIKVTEPGVPFVLISSRGAPKAEAVMFVRVPVRKPIKISNEVFMVLKEAIHVPSSRRKAQAASQLL